jgi:hypothetical protein
MPGFKPAKDRLTLLLGAKASHALKLKPMLIYCLEIPTAFKTMLKLDFQCIGEVSCKSMGNCSSFQRMVWQLLCTKGEGVLYGEHPFQNFTTCRQ